MNFRIVHFLTNIKIKYFLFVIIFNSGFVSCISHKELINFRQGDEKEPTLKNLPRQEILNQVDIKLQPSDIVSIIISSPEASLAAPFNLTIGQGTSGSGGTTTGSSYLISSDGTIDLPTLGSIKAEGLTTRALKDTIATRVSASLVNPSVNVRLVSFKISIIGEVHVPGSFLIESDRITVLEALAKAGDLTPYSDRKHIMIIREKNGAREIGEIDLKSTQFFTSPYYYLQQNDVVYVEPTKKKITQLQQPIMQAVQVGVSFLAIIIALFK